MEYIKNFEEELKKIAANLKEEFSGIRANRPTTKLVEDIKVDYFGQKVPIKQLGAIGVVPPREIQVNVWDKNAVGAVAKAIEEANVGLNPNINGNLIRMSLPALTEERRQELIRLIKKLAESYRINVRTARDNYNKMIKKSEEEGSITKDEKFEFLDKVQKAVDQINKEIELMVENKESEIKE